MCCTKLATPGLFGPVAVGGPPGLEGADLFVDGFLFVDELEDEPWFADGIGGGLIGSFAPLWPTGAPPPLVWARGFFP